MKNRLLKTCTRSKLWPRSHTQTILPIALYEALTNSFLHRKRVLARLLHRLSGKPKGLFRSFHTKQQSQAEEKEKEFYDRTNLARKRRRRRRSNSPVYDKFELILASRKVMNAPNVGSKKRELGRTEPFFTCERKR